MISWENDASMEKLPKPMVLGHWTRAEEHLCDFCGEKGFFEMEHITYWKWRVNGMPVPGLLLCPECYEGHE